MTSHQLQTPTLRRRGQYSQFDSDELLAGYAEKKNRYGVWNKRYFVLSNNDHYLMYYPDDKKDRGADSEKGGHVDLRLCSLTKVEGRVLTLYLHDQSKYQLRFGQESEAIKWKEGFYDVTIHSHNESVALRRPGKEGLLRGLAPALRGESEGPAVESSDDEDDGPEEGALAYAGKRAWLALSLLSLASSTLAVVPVPTLDLWFFKVFVLSGVFHGSVLSLLGLCAAISAAATARPPLGSKPRGPGLCAGALCAFAAAAALAALPTLANAPLALALPSRVDAFLAAAGLPAGLPASRGDKPAAQAFSLGAFMEDAPCALANVWVYFKHDSEVEYKSVPKQPGRGPVKDWSGLGGLSNSTSSNTALRLAVFGNTQGDKPKNGTLKNGTLMNGTLKPVLVSLHGGGWYRGSLYDGLQCYLPAAIDAGFAVVAAEYRSGADGWNGRAMVEDATDLLLWVQKNGPAHGLDPATVVVMGGSAGAHVGAVAAYRLNAEQRRRAVAAVVTRYGAVGDLGRAHAAAKLLPRGLGDWAGRGGQGWSERAALEHIAGGAPAAVASEYAFLSPPNHVGAFTPPTVLLHCAHDEFYNVDAHGGVLAARLAAAGVPHLLIAPRMHSHGCDIGSTAPFQFTRFALLKLLAALKAQPQAK